MPSWGKGLQLTKRDLESALEGEITDHLGYEKHDAAGRGSGNSRNGGRVKTGSESPERQNAACAEIVRQRVCEQCEFEGGDLMVRKSGRRLVSAVALLSAIGLTAGCGDSAKPVKPAENRGRRRARQPVERQSTPNR
ncbi:hypothetical protein ACFVOK_22160 [Streptomyces sp. NPDC057798]|uniref:hypothetical protein n=1 Tax=Streptomyces sp. NPDC057798 TaxID=3346252 RepID=UPI0036B85025